MYTEHELYGLLSAMFTTVFFDSDPANSFKLHTLSRELALGLEKLVRLEVGAGGKTGWLMWIAAKLGFVSPGKDKPDPSGKTTWPGLPHYGRQLLSRMMEKGKTVEECVAGTVMPIW